MKTISKTGRIKLEHLFVILACVLILLVALASGCRFPFMAAPAQSQASETPQPATLKPGRLTIIAERPLARTIMPAAIQPADLVYDIHLSRDGHNNIELTSLPYATSGLQIEVLLALGNWNLRVDARRSGEGTILFSATDTVTIVAEGNTVHVTLLPLQEGTGSFDFSITWPASMVTNVDIFWKTTPGGVPVNSADWPFTDSLDLGAGTLVLDSRPEPLASGNYFLAVLLKDAGDRVIGRVSEAVLILDGQHSTKSMALSAVQLSSPPEAPSGLEVTFTNENVFRLDWVDNADTEEGFRIYKGALGGTAAADVDALVNSVDSAGLGYSGSIGEAITYYIVAYNTFGESSPATITFTPGAAFRTVWNTENGEPGGRTVALPLADNGSYDFIVNWGDGLSDRITVWDTSARTHTYATVGTYNISIVGTISGWSFNNTGDRLKITDVQQWGPLAFGATEGQFYGAENLTISATDAPDLSGTTSLHRAFCGASGLSVTGTINGWDTSTITSMSETFRNTGTFNADISSWDTSNVTWMYGMFAHATLFNCDLSEWNTQNVTIMSEMFFLCSTFNGNVTTWDTSNVLYMGQMFGGAVAFNQNISSWNTAKVIVMDSMFTGATAFNQDISGWNTSSVTTMQAMFAWTTAFNQDISSWDTSMVSNMSYMFYFATAFNKNISGWITSSVTTMQLMFDNATAFNQDISSWETSSVTDMSYMFYGADAFNQNLGSWNISSVTTMECMFEGVTLSTANYDRLLVGWASQAVQSSVNFNGGNSRYSEWGAAKARSTLATAGWTISDGGQTAGYIGAPGPAGGIVFYDKGAVSDGWRYLEAWTADQSGTYQWKTSNTATPGTATAIGTGYANTYTAMIGTAHPAAEVARGASHGGKTDWFLPSKDELNQMYIQRSVIGGFASDYYWSSSENGYFYAWNQYFVYGSQNSSSKDGNLRVRVVRAFRSENPLYIVNYNANGATSGSVPVDYGMYEANETGVPIAANSGNLGLAKDGFQWIFTDWNTEADGSGISYVAPSTITMPSGNVTLYAQWKAIGATGPAGGKVFYDKGSCSNGWRYMETWTADQSSTYQWKTANTWTGGTLTDIGTGYANTYTAMVGTAHPAAEVARNASHGGHNDWFLPSKDELNQMYIQRSVIGNFASVYYWSSSEYDSIGAWGQNFGDGYQNLYGGKGYDKLVRVVRAFRSENPLYIISYNANGATSGSVPVDYGMYEANETGVPIAANSGNLVRSGFGFTLIGWNTEPDGSGTHYAASSTTTMPSSNLTLYAEWQASGLAIGTTGPAGGRVFYDKGNYSDGWRYLEAWTADQSGNYMWKTSNTDTPGTSTTIGTGYVNTYTAMAGTAHPAAEVAHNATNGGYSDWFLPSKDELNQMYIQRSFIGGFASDYYWSSSEADYNPTMALFQYFANGGQYGDYKILNLRVRVVRTF
jgi:surface protein